MTLSSPLALALSAFAIPIVLMYILKLRRQEHLVPSMLLWSRVVDDVQANAPWQRLRYNLLLLLQLLALAALVITLARPGYTQARTFDGDLIVIVDQSYGMQATDVSPSRFAVALHRAHDLAADLAGGHVMTVIGMGAQPRLEAVESSDRGVLDRAIDKLRVGVDPPNLLGAYSLAASLARSGQSTRVVILTSRDSGIAGVPLQAPLSTQIVRVGGNLQDLGITAFTAEPSGRALVRVSNFGSRVARSDLQLFADGQLADVRPLTVRPRQEQNLFWLHLPRGTRRLQARLTRADDMSSDKTAWFVLRGRIQHRVLLVTRSDYFLRTALALEPTVALKTVSPGAYVPSMGRSFDLVVFDGTLPPALPRTSALIIGPGRGVVGPIRFGSEPQATGTLEPGTSALATTLLKDASMGDVHVARVRQIALPGWLQPVALTGGLPAVAAGENGERLAIVAFNLRESDWPLRVSFPLVLQNLLRYLAPGLTSDASTVTVGTHVRLFPAPGAHAIDITGPGGQVDRLRDPFPPFVPTRAGIYRVREIGSSVQAATEFAVNFFPVHPAPAPGPDVLELGGGAAGGAHTTSTVVGVAWIFGLLWLVLLSAEWWFSFRR